MCAHALIPLCRILDELSKWFFNPHGVDTFDNIKSHILTHHITAHQLKTMLLVFTLQMTTLLLLAPTPITSKFGPEDGCWESWYHFQLGCHQASVYFPILCTLQTASWLVITSSLPSWFWVQGSVCNRLLSPMQVWFHSITRECHTNIQLGLMGNVRHLTNMLSVHQW